MRLGVDLRAVRRRAGGRGVPAGHAHIEGSSSFPCPQRQGKTQVIDSRPKSGGIYRRRACAECGHRATTFESEARVLPGAANRAILVVVKTLRRLADELEQAVGKDETGEPE